MSQKNIGGWFEIPVADMERAIKFYETVFDVKLSRNQMGPLDMAWFPWVQDGPGAAGTLVYHAEFYKPSTDGVLLYLSSPGDDLAVELGRIPGAGGIVLVPKTAISPDHGFMAVFMDTEGNRLSLHSLY